MFSFFTGKGDAVPMKIIRKKNGDFEIHISARFASVITGFVISLVVIIVAG